MNMPYLSNTGSPSGPPSANYMDKVVKSTPPMSKPMGGISTSHTKVAMILPNAPDNNTDGHIDHIAAHGKLFKFFEHYTLLQNDC